MSSATLYRGVDANLVSPPVLRGDLNPLGLYDDINDNNYAATAWQTTAEAKPWFQLDLIDSFGINFVFVRENS